MLKEKMRVTQSIRDLIIKERVSANKSGMELSKDIEKSSAWISSLENGRIKSITSIDLINIIKTLLNLSDKEAEDYIEKYLAENEKDTQEDDIVYYDEEHNDINEKSFRKIIEALTNVFNTAFEKNPKWTFNCLGSFIENMRFDIGFMFSLFRIPFYRLEETNKNTRQELFDELSDVVKKYLEKYSKQEDFEAN